MYLFLLVYHGIIVRMYKEGCGYPICQPSQPAKKKAYVCTCDTLSEGKGEKGARGQGRKGGKGEFEAITKHKTQNTRNDG